MKLRDVEYGGWICQGSQRIRYRKAGPGDAGQIAALYREIAITKENCREKLDIESMHSFEQTGGMFVVMTEEEIRAEIEKEDSFWAVFEDGQGKLGMSFWFAGENPLLEKEEQRYLPGSFSPGGVIYPREIIVSAQLKGKKAGQLAYITIMKAMLSYGYDRSFCDVYRVRAYEIYGTRTGGVKRASLLNKPSFALLQRIGGVLLGPGLIKEMELPGYRVWIEPQVFLAEHARVQLLGISMLRRQGIIIREDKEWVRKLKEHL